MSFADALSVAVFGLDQIIKAEQIITGAGKGKEKEGLVLAVVSTAYDIADQTIKNSESKQAFQEAFVTGTRAMVSILNLAKVFRKGE